MTTERTNLVREGGRPRRAVLRQLGMTTGVATVGLSGTTGADTVGELADEGDPTDDGSGRPSYDHVVAYSDVHVGSPGAYGRGSEGGTPEEDFTLHSEAFLDDVFFSNPDRRQLKPEGQLPDAFLLVGDVLEQWWRGTTASIFEGVSFLDKVREIHAAGVDVVLIGGNHDWWLMRVDGDEPVAPPAPWHFAEEFGFEHDGEPFAAVHGHQGDPFLNFEPVTNQAFCLGDDEQGYTGYEIWTGLTGGESDEEEAQARWAASAGDFGSEYYTVPDRFPAEAAPEDQDERDARAEFVREWVRANYDGFVVFGHTHRPEIGEDYANCGAWTRRGTESVPDHTYVEVRDGTVALVDWQEDEVLGEQAL